MNQDQFYRNPHLPKIIHCTRSCQKISSRENHDRNRCALFDSRMIKVKSFILRTSSLAPCFSKTLRAQNWNTRNYRITTLEFFSSFFSSLVYVYKSLCFSHDTPSCFRCAFMMYSLFWTRSELPSNDFYDYDGYIFCSHCRITDRSHSLAPKENRNPMIPLPYCSVSFISTWHTRCTFYC